MRLRCLIPHWASALQHTQTAFFLRNVPRIDQMCKTWVVRIAEKNLRKIVNGNLIDLLNKYKMKLCGMKYIWLLLFSLIYKSYVICHGPFKKHTCLMFKKVFKFHFCEWWLATKCLVILDWHENLLHPCLMSKFSESRI